MTGSATRNSRPLAHAEQQQRHPGLTDIGGTIYRLGRYACMYEERVRRLGSAPMLAAPTIEISEAKKRPKDLAALSPIAGSALEATVNDEDCSRIEPMHS